MKRTHLIQIYVLLIFVVAVLAFYYDFSPVRLILLIIAAVALGYSLFKSVKK